MAEFYPPRLDPLFVRLCQSISAPLGYLRYRMHLEIAPDGLERLTALRDHRLLFLSNHPTYHDWIAIFLLSARLGELFHYLAAHERFQGKEGDFLQRVGAYSIRRGLGDRASVAQTLEILMQPACRLVIFPEGGCSFQNDTVMPFRAGAIQIALQAMNKLVKQGEPVPDLYLVPLSLKYRYLGNMERVIANTLTRLEQALRIPAQETAYERLRAIAEQVMLRLEQDYGLDNPERRQLPWNDRIAHTRAHVLQSCEHRLGLTPAPGDLLRERVYKIQHVLESRAEILDRQEYESIHKAAARLLNFDAIYDGYVAAAPTPERFLDTLIRLEREVFGIKQPIPKGHRRVLLQIGEPINLKDSFEAYQRHKSSTVEQLGNQVRQLIQTNLNHLEGSLTL